MQSCVEPLLSPGAAGWCQELEEIIGRRRLQPVFQPIVDLDAGSILGYEGLIRGPSDSALHSPMMLFEAAERCRMTLPLDLACLRACAERFAELALPGLLFVNLHPETLLLQGQRPASILGFLGQIGLDSKRVILELTETRPNGGYLALREVTAACRQGGLRIALDDLGEGFSNLRLWSELRPDFVKLDKHFVQNIHLDPLKEQFVRSIADIARQSGALLVAEGIESAAELRTLCRLGVRYGQGYLLARPQANPAHALPLPAHALPWAGNRRQGLRNQPLARDLLLEVAPLEARVPNETAYRRFADHPDCFAIPVVEDGVPVGLLRRHHLLESFAKPFNRELYGKKPCHLMMDKQPLVVSADLNVHELSSLVVAAEQRYLVDGFIITENGRYLGMGTGFALMRKITELQLSAARYANPLTGLPGNVPINEAIDRLLGMKTPFVAAYADLDHFKPFNDLYGYAAGDSLIELVAHLLLEHADPERDFVGHVGGDDFVVLMQADDWEARLQCVLEAFGRLAAPHFSDRHREAGGFEVAARNGETVFQPLTTLSLGVVRVKPGQFGSHHEIGAVTAEAKKQAKKIPGNSLFVERRQPAATVAGCRCGLAEGGG
ncbi:GGDEF domain-containing protein [Chromobacterium subtsugae]|uniref:GGDEF domain-containing protein n=1 Tax=Chromobacterium subtsugae TaxID=251747 RepID=A0ABS7FBM7_9NEIS|nr:MULTISPECIES: GGDEF domain-containing protein [Chromobacterium]KUM02537.1 diguanylate cyclase [Chromobacterium subtsugae]KZE87922.1 diguanylate cyclase [Chromobacterium sp. F49]MBW7565416.1 GGDEF domain-containing protein [Chromobacterium subtsugae]MBW8286734.1 GGDEF domain-containing protein [Chromobacterium subtsugae]OBU85288.1 diguanylate cyclase [Chromobacterium subtsugae]